MNKKRLSIVAGFALVAMMMAGCSATPSSSSPVIHVWSWQTGESANQWNTVFKTFEKENPGLKVEFTGYVAGTYPTILSTGLSAGKGPDIAMMHPYSAMGSYIAADQLVPLDSSMGSQLKKAFTEKSLAASQSGGKQYGVPFASQSIQIFYNKTLFNKLGVQPPKTRDEWLPLLEKIKTAGVTPIAFGAKEATALPMTFDALEGTTYGGGKFISGAQRGNANWDNNDFVKSLNQFQELGKYFPNQFNGITDAEAGIMFAGGQAAMYPAGSWAISGIRKTAPNLDMGVFTLPAAGQSTGASPAWGYEDGSFAMSAKAGNPKGAQKLLQWMATPEFGKLFTETLQQPSSVLGVKSTDPVLQKVIANYQANSVPMIWVTKYFGVSSPAPFATLMNGLQSFLLGSSTAKSVATDVQASVDQWKHK